ncbi:MAG: ATP-binding cassette domain-containing protein [Candidatus Omnitrophota bacterium]
MIEAVNVYKYFSAGKGAFGGGLIPVKAVDGVTLRIPRSRTLGLVGESGSGKTTLGKIIAGIIAPDNGEILVDGKSVYAGGAVDRSALSGLQYIFQDPFSSLDPKMTVASIVTEGLLVRGARKADRLKKLREVLEMVSLTGSSGSRYPHEFSGGQRQRIAIARAIAASPSFIICDEPVSSLDVSIQAEILNLLKRIQKELGLTYLFISHDLSVVEYMADEIAVMFEGKIVESGCRADVYAHPEHPYTKRLMSSILTIPQQ